MYEYNIDLPGLYAASQQLKMRKAAEERAQTESAQAQQYRTQQMQAEQAAAEQRRAEFAQRQQEARADAAAKAQAEQARANANRQRMAAYRLASDPSVRIEDVVSPLAAANALPQDFDAAVAQYGAANDRAGLARVLEDAAVGQLGIPKPEETEALKPSLLAQKLREEGLKPNTREWFARARELNSPSAGGGININVGNGASPSSVGLTTAEQTNQQGQVIKADLRLKQLDNMDKAIEAAGGDDAIGSYGEQLSGALSSISNRAGLGGDPERLAKRAAAIAAIGGFTNPIISELAGANVPEGEMKRMTESLPRPEDPGPVRKAKRDAWRQNLQIIRSYGIDALVNGIRTGVIKLPGEDAAPQSAPPTTAPQTGGPGGGAPDLSQMSPEDMQRWAAEGK